MDYHGITSIGKIYVQRVSTLPVWSLTDIARILYANDTFKFHLGGNTSWREIVDCVTNQSLEGIKTFVVPPRISQDPAVGEDAVRLSYLQANYVEGTIDLTDYVTLSTNQDITGVKTFNTNLPTSTVAPTNNEDFTNKEYVDAVAPKVAISQYDSTMNYLWDKITAGDGIALAKLGMEGENQTLRISVSGITAGNVFSDLPVGTIIKYAGSSPPAHYLECDGAAVSRTTYSDLFDVIGEDYGAGNGTTTFNIPSCTGDNCGGEIWCIKYDEATSGGDELVKVSSDDTTAGYLEQKIVAGTGISLLTKNAGANETFEISSSAGASNNGFWLKSTGGNNCVVKAGNISINNSIYTLGADKSLTLSGYLRSGETVPTAATTMYLYAIAQTGTSVPTFAFSSVAPTKNKFGTTVSFNEEDGRSELYHPTEGLTWRYIGNLYHKGTTTPNLVAFDKHYPGYYETAWLNNPYSIGLSGIGYWCIAYGDNNVKTFDGPGVSSWKSVDCIYTTDKNTLPVIIPWDLLTWMHSTMGYANYAPCTNWWTPGHVNTCVGAVVGAVLIYVISSGAVQTYLRPNSFLKFILRGS